MHLVTVFKQHAERRDDSLRPTPLTKVRALGNGPLGSLPQLNLAMRTKPIVLYSCCGLGNLAVAPGDSQRRARPARANLASETAGAQTSPKSWRPARLPPLTHSPAASPGLPAAPIGSGIATDATSVVAPTPTAPTHHAHANATPTTTQATRYDRHPQSEGSNPGTRMQRQAITGY